MKRVGNKKKTWIFGKNGGRTESALENRLAWNETLQGLGMMRQSINVKKRFKR